ncbi:hypothetical protein DM860_015885 [Cuscuta australis]|uniref:PGG domain-containing protein n=1 Tax=Cuscuta australis TaxID=267555 RepID=A0A328E1U0_9ASTE|nr:hypothetical protein DM860_015885 [Cuscuta australis]
MEKQRSFKGLMEKQRSFRMGMERKTRFGGGGERGGGGGGGGKRGDTALHAAARAGNVGKVMEVVQRLGAAEAASQNQEGETALYAAAENGHAAVVRELLKHIDFDTASAVSNNGYDAFHVAAKQGHLEVLKELLSVFPNLVMTTDSSNSTALHTAAAQGHVDVVDLLLDTDSNLAKIARNNGKTALHTAARMGHLQVVRSLLGKDDPTGISFRTDKKGQTALHMATKGQNTDILLELIKPDPKLLSLGDNKGNTPLHIATKKGRAQIVQCLLSVEGINVNAVNKAGETALDMAEKQEQQSPEIVTILKEAGGVHSNEKPPAASAKHLKQTVSDIRHDVESQLQQSRQTGLRVRKIAKNVKKLHISGLNNAINSLTVVAVLIATVAFAGIFTVPGQYVEEKTKGFSLGEAHIAKKAAFIIFFLFDSIALFISLAVVVVQTSLVVTEHKARQQMVFFINKLMWAACLFISVAFIALTYVVVGARERWLAIYATAIGSIIMMTTIGLMVSCVIQHRREEARMRSLRRSEKSGSLSISSVLSDAELYNDHKRMYAV